MENTTYILLKDLPNLERGAEFTPEAVDAYLCRDKDGMPFYYNKKFVEGNLEWFKKKEPKQWEILALKSNGQIIYKEGYTFPECFQTLVNDADIFKIHSVKRLSDNEVFSIGDKVIPSGQIQIFILVDNDIYVKCSDYIGTIHLSEISKYNELQDQPHKEREFQRWLQDLTKLFITKQKKNTDSELPIKIFELLHRESKEGVETYEMKLNQCLKIGDGIKTGRALNDTQPKHTPEELLEAEQKAFYAATERITSIENGILKSIAKHPTFTDYKQDKNKEDGRPI